MSVPKLYLGSLITDITGSRDIELVPGGAPGVNTVITTNSTSPRSLDFPDWAGTITVNDAPGTLSNKNIGSTDNTISITSAPLAGANINTLLNQAVTTTSNPTFNGASLISSDSSGVFSIVRDGSVAPYIELRDLNAGKNAVDIIISNAANVQKSFFGYSPLNDIAYWTTNAGVPITLTPGAGLPAITLPAAGILENLSPTRFLTFSGTGPNLTYSPAPGSFDQSLNTTDSPQFEGLTITDGATAGIEMVTTLAGSSYIDFTTGAFDYLGRIIYSVPTSTMSFYSNQNLVMTLNPSYTQIDNTLRVGTIQTAALDNTVQINGSLALAASNTATVTNKTLDSGTNTLRITSGVLVATNINSVINQALLTTSSPTFAKVDVTAAAGAGIDLRSQNNSASFVDFTESSGDYNGRILYDHATDKILMYFGGSGTSAIDLNATVSQFSGRVMRTKYWALIYATTPNTLVTDLVEDTWVMLACNTQSISGTMGAFFSIATADTLRYHYTGPQVLYKLTCHSQFRSSIGLSALRFKADIDTVAVAGSEYNFTSAGGTTVTCSSFSTVFELNNDDYLSFQVYNDANNGDCTLQNFTYQLEEMGAL
jgi:hypothetical protein